MVIGSLSSFVKSARRSMSLTDVYIYVYYLLCFTCCMLLPFDLFILPFDLRIYVTHLFVLLIIIDQRVIIIIIRKHYYNQELPQF